MHVPSSNPIFTIGHSLHSPDAFCNLLLRYDVDVVLDVRSSPLSTRAPQFSRNSLQSLLREVGVRYSFGGKTLGGRPDDDRLYVRGQVSYEMMAATDAFVSSLRKLARGAKSTVVALLCAEADPIECHRFLLVSRALHVRGLNVQHILPGGALESQRECEERMLVATDLAQVDAFSNAQDALALAYQRQAARFAFVRPTHSFAEYRLESV